MKTYRPIFISGCDRSGATLLGNMLGNSRWSVTTPESQFFHELLIQSNLGSFCSPEVAATWLLDHFRFGAWGIPLQVRELAQLIDLEEPRTTIENLIHSYMQHTHPDKHNADVWIDPTPDSFKHYAMLKHYFPEARFIHIVRDGRAVFDSIKALDWGPNNAYMGSRHWAALLRDAMAVEVAEGSNCLRVRFEDLLSDQEGMLRRICNFADLPFEDSLLDKPLAASRVEPSPHQLNSAEIRDFESYPLAHKFLTCMGYRSKFEVPPRVSSLRVFGRYCHDFVHCLLHRKRHKAMERRAVLAHRTALNHLPD
jgi:hypothetical protein